VIAAGGWHRRVDRYGATENAGGRTALTVEKFRSISIERTAAGRKQGSLAETG